MNKLYAIGATTFVLGLLITVVTWFLYIVGYATLSKGLIIMWGLLAMTVFFECALDFTVKYLKGKEETLKNDK